MPRLPSKFAATGPRPRAGLTLIEALVSITITVTAGAAILLALSSALQTAETSLEQTVAHGLAQQLMDEVAGSRYMESGASPVQWPLGPGAGEGPYRAGFDDLDDFARYAAQPPVDRWGVALGADDGHGGLRHPDFRAAAGRLANWRTEIDVYYVSPSDLSTRLPDGDTSYYRGVQVRVLVDVPGAAPRTVADLRRVFAYVPAS